MDISASPVRPDGSAAPTVAALPPHPDIIGWYDWSSEALRKEDVSLGTPYVPSFLPTATRLYCKQGRNASFVSKPREIPPKFIEISSLKTQDDVKRVAASISKNSVTGLRAMEHTVRVGVAAQSYVHHFTDAALAELKDMRNIAHSSTIPPAQQVEKLTHYLDAQWHFLDQLKSCAKDVTGCLVAIDTNCTLRKRDALLDTLLPTYRRHYNDMRSANLSHLDLLPSTEEVIRSSSDDVGRAMLKTLLTTEKRKAPVAVSSASRKKRRNQAKRRKTQGEQQQQQPFLQSYDVAPASRGGVANRGAGRNRGTSNRGGGGGSTATTSRGRGAGTGRGQSASRGK